MEKFWLLNPDAELELSHLASERAGAYTTSKTLRASMSERRAAFLELTLGESSLLSHELEKWTGANKSTIAFFLWCATPSLLGRCRRLGLRVPANPDPAILAAVNDKTRLGEWELPLLPGRALLKRAEDLEPFQKRYEILRLKRAFGFAGRGQRRVSASLSPDDVRWVKDSLNSGPLVIEPELGVFQSLSVHLLIHREEIVVGRPVGFHCDDFGAFLSWDPHEVPTPLSDSLRRLAKNAGERLRSSGYFGPAGIDFAVTESGAIHALDLNGRFSLGWSRGMGKERERALLLQQSQTS